MCTTKWLEAYAAQFSSIRGVAAVYTCAYARIRIHFLREPVIFAHAHAVVPSNVHLYIQGCQSSAMALKSAPSAILKRQREKMKRHAARPSTIARAIFLPAPPLYSRLRNTREREIALLNVELGHENGPRPREWRPCASFSLRLPLRRLPALLALLLLAPRLSLAPFFGHQRFCRLTPLIYICHESTNAL